MDAYPEWRDPSRAAQFMATEHWGLLSWKSLSWNEAFARSGLYLTVLSASLVSLALVAQVTDFDGRFTGFALLLLAVVYFVGVTTIVRLQQSACEDLIATAGMNRLRAAYLELEPRLERFLVTSPYDDEAGLLRSAGVPPTSRLTPAHLFVTTPGMLSVVNSVVAAAGAGLAAAAVGAPTWACVAVGAVGFAVSLVLLLRSWLAALDRLRAGNPPLFPSPPA
jgi:hypothetical protein